MCFISILFGVDLKIIYNTGSLFGGNVHKGVRKQ